MKFTYIDTSYEPLNVSYGEMFSWQGVKFPKRANQHDEVTVRRKRDAKSTTKSTPSANKLSMAESFLCPEDGVLVIVENVTILDKFLFGSPRTPFRSNHRIFIIVITQPEERNFGERVNELLERLWGDYAVADLLLMTPCNNDSEVNSFDYHKVIYC